MVNDMVTERTAKPSSGVSFAEFARIIGKSKGYISQLKSASRLVLSNDGKRVLVEESKARIKLTSDPSKWPLTLHHEAARKKKEEESRPAELIPDPDEDFLRTLLADAVAPICAELMLDSGMSLQQAAHSYHAVCRAIVQTRENAGYKSELWSLASPVEQFAPEASKATWTDHWLA